MTTHADFNRAPERKRYTGSLKGLFVFLTFEAQKLPGVWCWRILKGGAVVSVRCQADGYRVLRIARSDRPEGDAAAEKWRRELATFLEHFGAPATWQRVECGNVPGVAVEYYERPEQEALPL